MSQPAATSPADIDQGWRRTSPLGILAAGARRLLQAILPIIAVMFGTGVRDNGPLVAAAVGLGVIVVNFLVAALAWWKMRYRVGETDIRIQRGLISRQARSVPFERIQDVSLEQRLFPRLLGLVEVRFETGAGGKDELKLAFVSEAEGEALRETVRAQLDGVASATTCAVTASAAPLASAAFVASCEAEPLFAMSPPRLLVFGMFEFSLVVFAALAGAAQQFDFLLPFDPWEPREWMRRLTGPGAVLEHWMLDFGWATRLLGLLIAGLTLTLVGLATGILRTFARDWGFRLERTAKGFRRRRGLLTRTDVVMPVHRVQALKTTTGLLRRLWGWHGLAFISLAQDAGLANHTVAPFARMAELGPIAREAGFTLSDDTTPWHRPSPHFRTDRAILGAAIPLAGGAAALFVGQPLVAAAAFLLSLMLGGRQIMLRHFERHAIDERQLFARTALLSPRTIIAMRAKLNSVEIGQGPLARLRGYACLRFGLAGGRLEMRGVPLNEARALRAAVLESITAVDFSRLPS